MSENNQQFLFVKNTKEKSTAIVASYNKGIQPIRTIMDSINNYENVLIKNKILYIQPVNYSSLSFLTEDKEIVPLTKYECHYYCPHYNDIFYKTIRFFGPNIKPYDENQINVDCQDKEFIKSYLPGFTNIELCHANKIRIPENYRYITVIVGQHVDLEMKNKSKSGNILIIDSSIKNLKIDINDNYELKRIVLEDDIEIKVENYVILENITFNGHKIKITSDSHINEITLNKIDISNVEIDPNIQVDTLKILNLKASSPIIFPMADSIYIKGTLETDKIIIDSYKQYTKSNELVIKDINIPIIFNNIYSAKQDTFELGNFSNCSDIEIENIVMNPETNSSLISFNRNSYNSLIRIKKIEFTSPIDILKIQPIPKQKIYIMYKGKELERLTTYKRKSNTL